MSAIQPIGNPPSETPTTAKAKFNLVLPFFKSDGSALVKNVRIEGQGLEDSQASNFLGVVGTLNSGNTVTNPLGVFIDITPATPEHPEVTPEQSAFCVLLREGATTGQIQMIGANVAVITKGEGTISQFNVSGGIRGNQAGIFQAIGETVGDNIGMMGRANNGSKNWGLLGIATEDDANTNIGVTGAAYCVGGTQVGGHFQLGTTFNALESCALLADNGNQAAPIARFRDNGTTKSQVSDGGDFECLTNAIGLVLVDRGTAARRRIICTNGLITTEAA